MFGLGKKTVTTEVEVTGMMCNMCEKHTVSAIEAAFDVKSVKASCDDNNVIIESAAPLDEAKLKACIEEAGYTPGAVTVK